jgi:mannose-6-phosphate isomerase-like protein (cupin superfamily)
LVEAGKFEAGEATVEQGQLLNIGPGTRLTMRGLPAATAYLFRGAAQGLETGSAAVPTSDFRSKYWGSIETIVNGAYTGKRLCFRKGQHSSLHFHCTKTETYFIHSGRLLIRLRAGRGEDRFFELPAGYTLNIPPGLMHQSGALEETVIMEISTHDEDSDSFLVEDGQRIPMPRLHAMLAGAAARPLKIVFDLDGCLCSQTDGAYERAAPVAKAIDLVNSLYGRGHEIIIHTSRFMGRSNGNPVAAYNQGFAFTERQLRSWGVHYHLLVMGKPPADLVVDDRAVFFRPDWTQIVEEIEGRIDPASTFTSIPSRTGQSR